MKTFITIVLLTIPAITVAQLPIIRANTKTVSVRDGSQFMKNMWTLSPEAKPDTYFSAFPQKNNTISFITDIDSISFNTVYGRTYDFIILRGTDSCYTSISANYNGVYIPQSESKIDTIPFTMHNSRIYFEGQINGHKNIAIQFDLGAGTSCVNVKSIKKTGVIFDGKINVTNTNGTNEEPSSQKNTLVIGKLKWEQIPVVQVRNMANDEDLIIGNSLFETKVIEIDYDKKIMIISDQLNHPPEGYSHHEVILEQHRPKIQATVNIAGKSYTDWFLFDTGRDGTMRIGEAFTDKYRLWNEYKTIFPMRNKKIIVIPEVNVGGLAFKEVVTNAVRTGTPSLLGNELLNHSNVILDNPNGMIYLQPNNLKNKTYATYIRLKYYLVAFVALLLFLFVSIRNFRRRIKPRR
jgi:hypothetical protein